MANQAAESEENLSSIQKPKYGENILKHGERNEISMAWLCLREKQ